jgi:hypothetical protein
MADLAAMPTAWLLERSTFNNPTSGYLTIMVRFVFILSTFTYQTLS